MRGCVTLLAALTVQGTLCLQHAISRGVWGVEAVMALYALLLCLALLALLSSLGLNLRAGSRLRRPVPTSSQPAVANSNAKCTDARAARCLLRIIG